MNIVFRKIIVDGVKKREIFSIDSDEKNENIYPKGYINEGYPYVLPYGSKGFRFTDIKFIDR